MGTRFLGGSSSLSQIEPFYSAIQVGGKGSTEEDASLQLLITIPGLIGRGRQ
jgi:hypothetical protein